jgi:hypothetical protein
MRWSYHSDAKQIPAGLFRGPFSFWCPELTAEMADAINRRRFSKRSNPATQKMAADATKKPATK